ncbi:MAG: aldehyde ferredoxin oxidoreductase family protein [Candidatus Thorarchaeota archaeon]|nr:aldehyde ferredoxin oxidoreductase family protein [Candidatus Thorarchaeota archaeon]
MTTFGWNRKILWIDLTSKKTEIEELSEEILEKYIGGKGLGAYLLYRQLEAGVDPLSPQNTLFFLTGPLQGLPAPNVGRWSVVTKSPLTGLFIDSHCGGPLGREIKKSGYDVVAIKGKSEIPVVVVINDERIEFEDAKDLWGVGTQDSTKMLHARHVEGSAVYVIGPAGENLVLTATGCCELAHQTGRGGIGAVLGSKKLKGLVVRGTKKIVASNPDILRETNKTVANIWKAKTDDDFRYYGTGCLVEFSNERGQFPTRNWSNSYFDGYESLNPEKHQDLAKGAHLSCPHCIMRCTHAYRIEDPSNPGVEVESTTEYETFGLCGGNLGISDFESVLRLNFLADDLGLDTISAGSTIGFAMDAFENGILSEEEIGFPLRFGDGEAALKIMRMIAFKEGIGATLAKGTRSAANEIGKGSESLAVHVKGLETAAWDPRGKLGLGLSYATADVGASHLRGWPQTTDKPDKSAVNVVRSMVIERDTKTLTDSMVICHFTWHFPLSREQKIALVNGATGKVYDDEEISKFGQRVETLTRLFNIREGITRQDDILPPKFWHAETVGSSKGMKAFIDQDDFEKSLNEYYALRGWGLDGVPTRETIIDLGLDSLVKDT